MDLRRCLVGGSSPPNRDEIIPSGGTTVGTMPPSVDEYPMGTFVEDYVYNSRSCHKKVKNPQR